MSEWIEVRRVSKDGTPQERIRGSVAIYENRESMINGLIDSWHTFSSGGVIIVMAVLTNGFCLSESTRTITKEKDISERTKVKMCQNEIRYRVGRLIDFLRCFVDSEVQNE